MSYWHRLRNHCLLITGVLMTVASLGHAQPGKAETQLKDAQDIQRIVERLRHQKITGQLKMGVVSKPEVISFIDKRIDEEYSSNEFKWMESTAKLLDLIPKAYDYRREIRTIMVEQIGGFYDHKSQELFIADWIAGLMQKPVLAHEIFHGVQVQEWNAGTLLDTDNHKLDQLMAHQALMEGDATVVMAHFMVADANLDDTTLNGVFVQTVKSAMHGLSLKPTVAKFMGSSEKFAAAPRYIKRSLVLPYAMGAEFIISLRQDAGWDWKRINEVYTDPPATTEQILRPERYWQKRDHPIIPKRPFKLPADWKVLKKDTFGLMMISESLDRKAAHSKAPRILDGWAGDETLLLGKADSTVLVINSAWDNKASAASFAEQWKQSYLKHSGCAVRVRGKHVTVVLAYRSTELKEVLVKMGLDT